MGESQRHSVSLQMNLLLGSKSDELGLDKGHHALVQNPGCNFDGLIIQVEFL